MKKRYGLLLIAFCGVCFVSLADSLTVEIQHVQGDEGRLAIALYDNASSFPKEGQEFKGEYADPIGTNVAYTFKDIPPGDYAVAVYHDENDNEKLDKNLFGVPKEGYGFSHGAKGHMGAPAFKDAVVTVKGASQVSVPLEY